MAGQQLETDASSDVVESAPVTEEDNGAARQKSFAGLRVLSCGLVMGVLADALLRTTPFGLNVPLWVCALAVTLWLLAGVHGRRLSPIQHGLVIAACGFAAIFAWRDSEILALLNAAAVVVTLSLAAVPETLMNVPLHRAGFVDYAANGTMAGVQSVGGVIPLLSMDITWSSIPSRNSLGQFKSAALGVLIAVPLLLIFGGLLVKADAAFEAAFKRLFSFDGGTLGPHVIAIGIGTWFSAGFLRLLVPAFEPAMPKEFLRPSKLTLSSLTVCVPLALINLLFLSFIAVQLQHLFGGHEWVRDPAGPTYAEYARRGFLELAMVVSLALPLLMVADWSLRNAPRTGKHVFRGLSAATLVMLLIISASALHRMMLYLEAYGLTRLRFYTTAFMLWLSVLTVWFALTVLREHRQPFMSGVVVTGLIAILALNASNPDACIARTNLAREQEGKHIDYEYLSLLSTDAAPALPPSLLPELLRPKGVVRHYAIPTAKEHVRPVPDFRNWNWSRSRAEQLLK